MKTRRERSREKKNQPATWSSNTNETKQTPAEISQLPFKRGTGQKGKRVKSQGNMITLNLTNLKAEFKNT